MGLIIPDNKKPVCNKYDRGGNPNLPAPEDYLESCSKYYKADGVTMKTFRATTDGPPIIPDAICVNTGTSYTASDGTIVNGTGGTNAASNEYMRPEKYIGPYNGACALDSVASEDVLKTKQFQQQYMQWEKYMDTDPKHTEDQPPYGGCYIKNSFPPCSTVDSFRQDLEIAVKALAAMYQGSFVESAQTVDMYNCIKLIIMDVYIGGDLSIEQSVKIKVVSDDFISSLATMDVQNQFKAVIKAQMKIMTDTFTSGCTDRVPTPPLPPSLNSDVDAIIDTIFETQAVQENIIHTIQQIHMCNTIDVILRDSVIEGNYIVTQEITVEAYLRASITAVMDIVVENEALSEITSSIESAKTNRVTEEDITGGQRQSSIPFFFMILGAIFLATVGFLMLKSKKKKPKGKKRK